MTIIVVMKDLNFSVNKGDIFIVMGVSGCGKSTLLKSMIGLKEPTRVRFYFMERVFGMKMKKGNRI